MSQVGLDKGSSFNLVSCARCGTPVGRTYITTSGQLDAARGAIALLASNVTLYKLGTGPDVDVLGEHMGIASHMARLQVAESNVVSLRDTCDYLAQQVAKLQTMVLLLHEQKEGAPKGSTSGSGKSSASRSSPSGSGSGSGSKRGAKRQRPSGRSSSGSSLSSTTASPTTPSTARMTSLSALASPGGAGSKPPPAGGSGSALVAFLSSPRGLAALSSPPPATTSSKSSSKKGKRRIAPQLVSPAS